MLDESGDRGDKSEVGNISAAAGSLRRMLSELQGLEIDNARLHFAMSSTRHSIRQRLDMLSGIAESLKGLQPPLHARELCERAERLIFQLSGELERLALEAEHEFEWAN
jgi:hypothetical protein